MEEKQLLRGSTEMVILAALEESAKHGYDIFQWVKKESNSQFNFSAGMLYPLLHKMEQKKLITAKWIHSIQGPKRKEYSLTPKGLKELATQKKRWVQFTSLINKMASI